MARRKWYSTEKGAAATAGLNSARLCWCLEDSENVAMERMVQLHEYWKRGVQVHNCATIEKAGGLLG